MSHPVTHEPLVHWSCDKCGAAGEISLPPQSYGCDAYALACQAHALAAERCHGVVRVGSRAK